MAREGRSRWLAKEGRNGLRRKVAIAREGRSQWLAKEGCLAQRRCRAAGRIFQRRRRLEMGFITYQIPLSQIPWRRIDNCT